MIGFASSTIWRNGKNACFKNACGKAQDGEPSAKSVKEKKKKRAKLMVEVKLHGCNHGDQSSSDAEINEHNLFIFISRTDDER